MWCGDHTVNFSKQNAAEFETRRLTPPGSLRGGVLDVVQRPHRKPLGQNAAEFATRRLTPPGILRGGVLNVVR